METCHRLFGSVQNLTAKKERGERIRLPFNSLALGDVVTSFRNTLHDNATAGVFTIGMFLAFYFLLIFLQLLRGGCQGWAGLSGLACRGWPAGLPMVPLVQDSVAH